MSILSSESIQKAWGKGLDITFGDFAENIATSGINWPTLQIGTNLEMGYAAVMEITQIGKECHNNCAIYYMAVDRIIQMEGIFAWVLKGGRIRCGDEIRIL